MYKLLLTFLIGLSVLSVSVPAAVAHPADITVTDLFVEQDWDDQVLADTQLRVVHSLNWFVATSLFDFSTTTLAQMSETGALASMLAEYLNENLVVSTGGEDCTFTNIAVPDQLIEELVAIGFFFNFNVVCPVSVTTVSITATFLQDTHPEQSNYLTLYRSPGDLIVAESVSGTQPTLTYTVADPTVSQSSSELLMQFVYEGVRHIVPLGLDHILFIITVFLIAGSLRQVVLYSLLFTLAHSLTLALTVLGVIVPNSGLIEAIIALSIVALAVDAIRPTLPQRWQGGIIFLFGLFHGMGFASVLTDLGLPAGAEVLALIGFNVGVELGQLGIVLALTFATYWLFQDAVHKRLATIMIATAIATVATWWLVERTLL